MEHQKFGFVSDNAKIGKHTIIKNGAIIEDDCFIGDHCLIGYHAILRRGTRIDDYSVFGTHSVSEGWNRIGSHTTIHSQCHITQDVEIDDYVFIAPFFCGANTKKIVHYRKFKLKKEGYRIKFGARIAIGVLVLPDVTIGREAFVGAGALVTKDVPDYTIVVGSPARIVGKVSKLERL